MHTPHFDSPRDAFDAIARDLPLRYPGVTTGKMFGVACIKLYGKVFATLQHDGMAFKLAGDAHRDALALPGAQRWEPTGRRRPMREWVYVPFAQAHAWPACAEQSLAYLAA